MHSLDMAKGEVPLLTRPPYGGKNTKKDFQRHSQLPLSICSAKIFLRGTTFQAPQDLKWFVRRRMNGVDDAAYKVGVEGWP